MSNLERYIPLIGQLRASDSTTLTRDLIGGLTTAVMLVPQAMAYAMLAGLPPITGLYASVLPLVLYAFLGTSRQLAVGPVAMVSLLVASGVGTLAEPATGAYVGYALLLAGMVGVLQTAMGVLRLGFLVNFLSHPVVSGFTSAAALIIGFSQLKHLLGVKLQRSHHIHEILLQAFEHISEIQPLTLGIGIASIVLLTVLKKVNPRLPRHLAVVALGTVGVWALGLDQQGVKVVGEVPAGLPPLSLPTFDLGAMQTLLPMAITISLVGFMESISVAKNFARKNKYEVDASQELIALGVANLGATLTSGYPVTGGFSRTAVNAQAGASTGLASLITAVAVAATLLLLTPLFYYLPMAVLASIIMTAVFGLVDFAEARHLWKVSKADLIMMGVTFFATLSLGIEQGILVGVATSLGWFVYKTTVPHVAVLGRLPESQADVGVYRNIERHPTAEQIPGVLLLRVDAPLFFGNTSFLKQTLKELESERTDLRAVVLDATAITDLDASAGAAFQEIIEDHTDRGVELWLAGIRGPVMDVMERSHLVEQIGADHFVLRVEDAVQALTDNNRPRAIA